MDIRPSSKWPHAAASGFTLLELTIAVAIIAILAAIAVPSYRTYVVRTNRAAAEACLSQYASYMERFYATNLQYNRIPANPGAATGTANPLVGTTPSLTLDCAGPSQTGNNYTIIVPAASATGYTIQATPIHAQLRRDTQCGTLTLNQIGTRTRSGTGSLAQCWGG